MAMLAAARCVIPFVIASMVVSRPLPDLDAPGSHHPGWHTHEHDHAGTTHVHWHRHAPAAEDHCEPSEDACASMADAPRQDHHSTIEHLPRLTELYLRVSSRSSSATPDQAAIADDLTALIARVSQPRALIPRPPPRARPPLAHIRTVILQT